MNTKIIISTPFKNNTKDEGKSSIEENFNNGKSSGLLESERGAGAMEWG